jgi:hypothetical protein
LRDEGTLDASAELGRAELGWRDTGTTTLQANLKPISYTLMLLRARQGSTATVQQIPLEPLAVAP